MKGVILQIETASQIEKPLSVTSVLAGTYRVGTILTLLKPSYQYLLTAMCGNSGCVKNKAQRQGQNLPPIADSCVSSERINYVDNSHIATNLDCLYDTDEINRLERRGYSFDF